MNRPANETLKRIHELAERHLSVEEFEAYVHAPMTEQERENILESIRWFRRRYPTAGERLAATRRAYKEWTRGRVVL